MRTSLYAAHTSINLPIHPSSYTLSHQSMQHKPLFMQLAGQTGWKWLQFVALIAFCRDPSLELSMTSWHINTYKGTVDILYTDKHAWYSIV